MNKTQKIINEMYAGSVSAIISGITSNLPILILNAIIAGTKFHVSDQIFVQGVLDAETCETMLLNIPIKHVASAALHILGLKEYQGNNMQIKAMIENKFDI